MCQNRYMVMPYFKVVDSISGETIHDRINSQEIANEYSQALNKAYRAGSTDALKEATENTAEIERSELDTANIEIQPEYLDKSF